MALVTGAELTAALGLDPSQSAAATLVAAASSAAVRAYLGFSPETTTYTDYLSPNGGADLTLTSAPPGCPVTVTTVHEDTERVFGSDTLLVAGTDYQQIYHGAFKSWALRRIGRNWWLDVRRQVNRLAGTIYPSIGTVKAVYAVDTADVLAAAKEAALGEAMARWNLRDGGMGVGLVTSDSMDGASVSVSVNRANGRKTNSADGFVSPYVSGMIDSWRRIVVA